MIWVCIYWFGVNVNISFYYLIFVSILPGSVDMMLNQKVPNNVWKWRGGCGYKIFQPLDFQIGNLLPLTGYWRDSKLIQTHRDSISTTCQKWFGFLVHSKSQGQNYFKKNLSSFSCTRGAVFHHEWCVRMIYDESAYPQCSDFCVSICLVPCHQTLSCWHVECSNVSNCCLASRTR